MLKTKLFTQDTVLNMGLCAGFSWVQDLTIALSQYFRNLNHSDVEYSHTSKMKTVIDRTLTLLLTQELQKD